MLSYVQVVTTPTADTPGTLLLLHFDTKRYLVGNLSEGTQRAAIERGVKLLKVSEIFLTGRTESANIGGLIGMILSLADVASHAREDELQNCEVRKNKVEQNGSLKKPIRRQIGGTHFPQAEDKFGLKLFGAPNLNHALATARNYVFRKGMPVTVQEFKHGTSVIAEDGMFPPTWSDDKIKVWAMPLVPHPRSMDMSKDMDVASSPKNRRKRSYADYDVHESANSAALEGDEERIDRYDQIRRAIVSDMFDSSWRLDALVEMPLSEVKLPASLWVRDRETKKIAKYDGPLPGSPDFKDVTVLLRQPWPGALVDNIPPTEPAKEAISYIIRNHPQRGRFRPEIAESLQVDKLPNWKLLTKGQSVTNRHGRIITPDMVLDKGKPGGGFAVIDLPSTDYVQPLTERAELRSPHVMEGVGAIFWILGPGVASDANLQAFMSELPGVKHIVSSKDLSANIVAFESAAAATARLSQIDPNRFRVPVYDNRILSEQEVHWRSLVTSELPPNTVLAQRGYKVQLTPALTTQEDEVVPALDIDSILSETSEEVLNLAQVARDEVAKDRLALESWSRALPSADAEIITLGTGSASPSKYRNVSGTLVRVPGYGTYLFDCGENTLGQLKRVLKHDEFNATLRDLRMIWISHMHADHHLGTISVIRAWYQETCGMDSTSADQNPENDPNFDPQQLLRSAPRLAVISEFKMLHSLKEFSALEDFGFNRISPLQISAADPVNGSRSYLQWYHSKSPFARLDPVRYADTALGFSDIQAVNVDHCYGARAVALTFPNGFKISYSGDCRPSGKFARIGKGSTVLIHEATFDDELVGDAKAKKHSTTSEALRVAAEMEAKAVVLTHFSQRYAQMPVMRATNGERHSTVEGVENSIEDGDATMTDGPLDLDTSPRCETATTADSVPRKTMVRASSGAAEDMKVCVAFDYMRVRVGDIAQLEKFTPALLKLYQEAEKEKEKEGNEGPLPKAEPSSLPKAQKEKKKSKGKGKEKGEG